MVFIRHCCITVYCIFCICPIRGQCMVVCVCVYIIVVYCVCYCAFIVVYCVFIVGKRNCSQWKHFLFFVKGEVSES